MNRFFLTACLASLALVSGAQAISVPAGKKFQVVINSTSNTSVTVMGQSIDNTNDMTSLADYTVTNVTPTGYTLSYITRKISGTVSVMGQEQKFDTDDEAFKNSPQAAGILGFIGKPQEIKVENGHVAVSESMDNILSKIGMSGTNQDEFSKLFFMPRIPGMKQGTSWSDSTVSPAFKLVNQYLVTSVTDQQVEMRVTTDTKMNTKIKQGAMDVETDMRGFATATRVYDRQTGLLVSQKLAAEMTGTAEGMGVKAPMTIKSTTLITVK